jgi:uncharacterized protein (TIGR00369 family)
MEQTQTADRTRTYSWGDPTAGLGRLRSISGLEMLQAVADGSLPVPPALRTLAITGVQAESGRVVFAMTPQEWHLNPLGTVHGGVLASLLDTAAGCAVHSTLDAGRIYTSLDLSVTFLRAARPGSGELTCTGQVVSRSTRTSFARAEVHDPRGRLMAHATSTCLLMSATD